MRRKQPKQSSVILQAEISDLSHDGRGVAKLDGKTIFISGALPGEQVEFRRKFTRRKYDEGVVVSILRAAPERIDAKCAHYEFCGGCSLQHLAVDAQVRARQNVLAENFRRIGKLEPEAWLPPLQASVWNYRRRARLGMKWLRKHQRVVIGFRERHTPQLVNTVYCHILDDRVSRLFPKMVDLFSVFSAPDSLPQLEVSVADSLTAIVIRHMQPLADSDIAAALAFGREHNIQFYSQSGNPDTIVPLDPPVRELAFRLAKHDITIAFEPSDFIQVNSEMNALMVDRAIELLAPAAGDKVLDLFCGLGNFTLPIARRVQEITGIEADAGLVARARLNATRNNIGNAVFHAADLFEPVHAHAWAKQTYDAILLDPPRAGAEQLCRDIKRFKAKRIVYVSCHPGSLVRDAAILVGEHGYRLVRAGVMDMFPHTSHLESIALFEAK